MSAIGVPQGGTPGKGLHEPLIASNALLEPPLATHTVQAMSHVRLAQLGPTKRYLVVALADEHAQGIASSTISMIDSGI